MILYRQQAVIVITIKTVKAAGGVGRTCGVIPPPPDPAQPNVPRLIKKNESGSGTSVCTAGRGRKQSSYIGNALHGILSLVGTGMEDKKRINGTRTANVADA